MSPEADHPPRTGVSRGPAGGGPLGEPVRREAAPVGWPGATPPRGAPAQAPPPAPGPAPTAGRPAAQSPYATTAAGRAVTVGPAAARKPGRRARLTVKRIDPWSTLKFSFVYSLAGFVVLLVAVVALYGIVDAMGVIDSIRSFVRDVSQPKNGQGVAAWLGFGRVLTITIVVGIINVILFTAFATLSAFIYNVCTDLVGGVEVTLAERS